MMNPGELVEAALEPAARRLSRGVAIAALGCAAAGFLLAGVFIWLETVVGAIAACFLIAAVCGAGAAGIAFAAPHHRSHHPVRPRTSHGYPPLMGAGDDPVAHLVHTFIAGVRAGSERAKRGH